ncbi:MULTISPECIES: hypothetical protein [Akkermansia]|uniref:hypothetical protein n=1 Tax=Akkermansia TaxID=239934 RepID=UPI001C0600B4|nr:MULTISPECIES: hypothetical protein [Akkermansia]MBS6841456.1 hypothetical protein [Akkermansia sp.]MCC8041123.1 hypothetical protein [Akkermansia sp.]MEE0533247.1 hypothetical protein [Akkermansia sp.]QWP03889.1 hypothetical protein J5W47_04745 [Akkermansia massiliensis]QWP22560.1 hypothetical protein J5W63_04735 [Akkermansia massiliensis]
MYCIFSQNGPVAIPGSGRGICILDRRAAVAYRQPGFPGKTPGIQPFYFKMQTGHSRAAFLAGTCLCIINPCNRVSIPAVHISQRIGMIIFLWYDQSLQYSKQRSRKSFQGDGMNIHFRNQSSKSSAFLTFHGEPYVLPSRIEFLGTLEAHQQASVSPFPRDNFTLLDIQRGDYFSGILRRVSQRDFNMVTIVNLVAIITAPAPVLPRNYIKSRGIIRSVKRVPVFKEHDPLFDASGSFVRIQFCTCNMITFYGPVFYFCSAEGIPFPDSGSTVGSSFRGRNESIFKFDAFRISLIVFLI